MGFLTCLSIYNFHLPIIVWMLSCRMHLSMLHTDAGYMKIDTRTHVYMQDASVITISILVCIVIACFYNYYTFLSYMLLQARHGFLRQPYPFSIFVGFKAHWQSACWKTMVFICVSASHPRWLKEKSIISLVLKHIVKGGTNTRNAPYAHNIDLAPKSDVLLGKRDI